LATERRIPTVRSGGKPGKTEQRKPGKIRTTKQAGIASLADGRYAIKYIDAIQGNRQTSDMDGHSSRVDGGRSAGYCREIRDSKSVVIVKITSLKK